ncbi:MAG: helix-turn-helix transcriptional regulator [Pseudomonadales bacterium]
MREERRREDAIKTFGLVIKEHRLQRGLSQDDLASLIGMDRAHLSLLETGKKQPTLSTIFNVCVELGVEVSVVFAEIERRIES